MKTLKKWEKSKLDLDDYLSEPCEIDEDLSNYIGEVIAPQYCGNGLTQGGDAIKSEESYDNFKKIYFYMTTSYINGKHFYLGILPEFKQ